MPVDPELTHRHIVFGEVQPVSQGKERVRLVALMAEQRGQA